MDARRTRAEEILATGMIERQGHIFRVPSQSAKSRHSVILDDDGLTCSCLDFEERQLPCKHILTIQVLLEREQAGLPLPAPAETPQPPKRKTYPQDWPNYNAAMVNEKDHFQDLLSDLCCTVSEPHREGVGRKPVPFRDGLFAAVFKVYTTVSARRFMCDLDESHRRGHIGCVPHFNSVLKALDNPAATPVLFDLIRRSALPLSAVETEFAVDSSGFVSSRFIRWFDVKYGTTKHLRAWVKLHIATGVRTNIVAAAEIADMRANDSPLLPPLVNATTKGFRIHEVSADKAYVGTENFQAVADHGGTLYAPFKTNTTASVGGIYEKMFHLFNLNREDYLRHYHK
jgi:hypothetical protein